MGELRWILAGLGVALIAALYLWGRIARRPRKASKDTAGSQRDQPAGETGAIEPGVAAALEQPVTRPARVRSGKIITLRLVPKDGSFSAQAAIAALEEAGLSRGRYGIYHYSAPPKDTELFSVANLVEPGSLEFEDPEHDTFPGMSFFIVLPGASDAVQCFDKMVQTARLMAVELEGELFDDRGSSWSIQRERYVREELIRYRFQPAHG